MSSRKYASPGWAIWLAACCLAIALGGCSEKGGGSRVDNQVPDTFISFGPREDSQTYFKVQTYWYGTDQDGTISHYQIATLKGVSRDSLANLDLNEITWTATAATESTFVLSADSCCATASSTKLALAYWGVLVRAVDNEGMADSSPASVFFQASNIVPRVRVVVPHKIPQSNETVSTNAYFEWRGEDADGDVSKMFYKYITVPVDYDLWYYDLYPKRLPPPPLPPLDSVYTGPKLPHAVTPVGYWSDWVPADCTYVKDANFSAFLASDNFLEFCVTCKDEGGAVLPEALFGPVYNVNNNWVMLRLLAQGAGVKVTMDAGSLGLRNSNSQSEYQTNVAGLFRGTQVSFRFWGSGEDRALGKLASEYRYYYDDPEDPRTSTWNYWTSTEPIRTRGNTPEWFVRYPSDGRPFVPTLGPHIFVVELRDLNKDVTHCEFKMEVLEGPTSKPEKLIYLVDDDVGKWMEPRYANYKRDTRVMWADILDGYNYEVFDTGGWPQPFNREPPIRRISDASTVIWVVDKDTEIPDCQLTKVCALRGNYLNSYVKVEGNLILLGYNPVFSTMFWPDRDPPIGSRGEKIDLDFTPRINPVDSTLMYNFNYEAFGIEHMMLPNPPVATSDLWPCESGWPSVTAREGIPGTQGAWLGRLEYIFCITHVRDDIPVKKIYSFVPLNEVGQPGDPQCDPDDGGNVRLIGVYVPPVKGVRGGAAYIGIPPWFFSRDEVKALIRKLLTEFGEPGPGGF